MAPTDNHDDDTPLFRKPPTPQENESKDAKGAGDSGPLLGGQHKATKAVADSMLDDLMPGAQKRKAAKAGTYTTTRTNYGYSGYGSGSYSGYGGGYGRSGRSSYLDDTDDLYSGYSYGGTSRGSSGYGAGKGYGSTSSYTTNYGKPLSQRTLEGVPFEDRPNSCLSMEWREWDTFRREGTLPARYTLAEDGTPYSKAIYPEGGFPAWDPQKLGNTYYYSRPWWAVLWTSAEWSTYRETGKVPEGTEVGEDGVPLAPKIEAKASGGSEAKPTIKTYKVRYPQAKERFTEELRLRMLDVLEEAGWTYASEVDALIFLDDLEDLVREHMHYEAIMKEEEDGVTALAETSDRDGAGDSQGTGGEVAQGDGAGDPNDSIPF